MSQILGFDAAGGYAQGRKNIFSYSAIPHNNSPENFGTILNSQYGDGVEITRIEGTGNGGFSLKINQATEDEILLLGSSDNPTYMPNNGPIDIKVYDPANVTSGTFTLKFDGVQDTARWSLYDDNGQFVVNSAQTIQVGNEQLLPSLGISINVAQVSSPKYINPASGSLDLYVTGSGVDALIKVSLQFHPESIVIHIALDALVQLARQPSMHKCNA